MNLDWFFRVLRCHCCDEHKCTSERHVITSVYISFLLSRFEFAFSFDPDRTDSVICALLDRELIHHRGEITSSVINTFDHTLIIQVISEQVLQYTEWFGWKDQIPPALIQLIYSC